MAPVSGTNFPLTRMNVLPLTGAAFWVWPSTGGGGAAALGVVNVWSGPLVVPALLVATIRTWYTPPAIRFVRFADTDWLLVPEPTCWGAVDWS